MVAIHRLLLAVAVCRVGAIRPCCPGGAKPLCRLDSMTSWTQAQRVLQGRILHREIPAQPRAPATAALPPAHAGPLHRCQMAAEHQLSVTVPGTTPVRRAGRAANHG